MPVGPATCRPISLPGSLYEGIMKKSRKLSIVAGVVLVVLVAAFWGYTSLNGAAAEVDASKLATVERGTMVKSVVATGKIEPITKVEIKSKANGIIEKLYVDVDQVVSPTQILAELDKEQLRARVRELEASLQAKRAALQGAEAQLKKNRIEAESPDVEFARRNYDRASNLFGQKLLSQSGIDDAHSALEVAQNRQRAAQGQLIISEAKVSEARAAVAEAQAAIERAQEELANATIRAPIRATVLTRDVEVGSPVSSILNLGANATLVLTLGDIDQVFVRGKVDEADIGRVRLGQPARIRVETFKDKMFEGRVTQISPIGAEKDNVTTFEVKVSIENGAKELKANMTANAEIVLEEHPRSLIIPEAAITYDAQRNATVDVLDPEAKDGRKKVTIKIGVGNGTKTQVISGLKEGDRIVLPS
jgi:HlyD family secretion protein